MSMYPLVDVREEVGAVLDPLETMVASHTAAHRGVATRPLTLDGQTLAVIDNGAGAKFRERLVQRLRDRFAFEDVIHVLKDTVNVPPRPEDWQEVVKRGTVGLALYGA